MPRGFDHFDHLGVAIDARFPDVAILIGKGVVRVVALGRLRVRRDDAIDLHSGHARLVTDGAEDGFQRAKSVFLAARDRSGIGQVRCRRVQPHELRRHGTSGNIEDVHAIRLSTRG